MSIKIRILISLLLLGCLLDVPYGYFQFIRVTGFVGFIYLSYLEFINKKRTIIILTVICAILLNPIFKIHFTRRIWNNIDLIIAIGLIIWVISDLTIKTKKEDS